jgi:predicted NUDIX family phosphoesterase
MAEEIIRGARTPLTPEQILRQARLTGWCPPIMQLLRGRTQHKTMNARLSEDIRRNGDASPFFRTGPSRFFLRELIEAPDIRAEWRKVYVGPPRGKPLRQEAILVAPKELLAGALRGTFVSFDADGFSSLLRNGCFFMNRGRAERDDAVKQFVTYGLVWRDTHLLTYRRGRFSNSSSEVIGARSIGFGGHVQEDDFDLFMSDANGLAGNFVRELQEELVMPQLRTYDARTLENIKILGYLNVDDTPDARRHVAVVMSYRCPQSLTPRKRELSINDVRWMTCAESMKSVSAFELWSRILLGRIFNRELSMSPQKS